MQLRRLAALERKKIEDEYIAIDQAHRRAGGHPGQPGPRPAHHQGRAARAGRQVRRRRAARASQDDADREMTDEDLIADEDVVVTVSGRGYIKRQPLATYRRQARGGKGIIGAPDGRGGRARPPAGRQHPRLGAVLHEPRPRLQLQGPRHPRRQPPGQGHARSSTSRASRSSPASGCWRSSPCPTSRRATTSSWPPGAGIIKKTPVEQFERVRSTGIRAITVAEDDALAWVAVSSGEDDIVLPPRRARSRASTRTRSGRWVATPPASSASASPARATRSWAWAWSRARKTCSC